MTAIIVWLVEVAYYAAIVVAGITVFIAWRVVWRIVRRWRRRVRNRS